MPLRDRRLPNALWISAACAAGSGAALLPFEVALLGAALLLYLLLAALTPFAALLFTLMLAPLRTLLATESALQLPLDIGQITLIGFVTAWGIHRIVRKSPLLRLQWSPVYLPVFAFAAALTLSAFTAVSLGAWLTEWLKWIQVLLLMALVLDLGQQSAWLWLRFALVAAGAAHALLGLYIFLGGSGADHLVIAELSSANRVFFRAFGTFGQPNPFGAFMGLLAPLALTGTLSSGIRLWRKWHTAKRTSVTELLITLFYAGAAALISLGVAISWSRGAWLGFAAALVVIAFALPRRTRSSLVLVAVLAASAAVLWLSGRIPASITDRIASFTQETFAISDVRGVDITPENYALVERVAHWQAALHMAEASPWLGIGAGNYEVVYPQYRLLNWAEPLGHAHNYYLNIFAEAGMIGLGCYSLMWLTVFWFTWRTRRHPNLEARLTAVGLLGAWTYLSIHSLTDNLYVNNMFIHIGVMLGILAVLHRQVYSCAKLVTR